MTWTTTTICITTKLVIDNTTWVVLDRRQQRAEELVIVSVRLLSYTTQGAREDVIVLKMLATVGRHTNSPRGSNEKKTLTKQTYFGIVVEVSTAQGRDRGTLYPKPWTVSGLFPIIAGLVHPVGATKSA